MKQDDATGARAKKGIGWLGNRHGSKDQVGRVRFHRLALVIVPVEGDDDRSVRKLMHLGDVLGFLGGDPVHVRTRQTGDGGRILRQGSDISQGLPGRGGKDDRGHEEPQQGW
jgi:hypothetical protein|tara:strand:+ start:186 stop:521 length:336 start_codon:yes stop_codon:yes gene_type:complete